MIHKGMHAMVYYRAPALLRCETYDTAFQNWVIAYDWRQVTMKFLNGWTILLRPLTASLP